MKKTLFTLLFALLFTGLLQAQKQKSYITTKFIHGCPTEIESIAKLYAKQSGLTNLSYSNLETGIDSIKVVFGKMSQGEQNGYWVASYIKNKFTTFSTVELLKNETNQFPTNNTEILYDNSSKKISIQLVHNTSTDEIQYLWYNDMGQKSKVATMIKIDKPIQKNKLFPPMKVVTLNDESISVKDYIGKFVVINWWATNCAPCRQEMPGLNSLVEKYKSNQGIVFLAIAFDKKKELESFLNSKEFSYKQTLGDQETAKLFGESFPKNIIVNPQGVITYYTEGGNENKFMEIDNELKKQIENK